tara:strand:- start:124 stop:303 length:180 start_codon:yes stop_codon:yes gene_type:complete
MIKYIINKIKNLFTPKRQMDEHIEYYTVVPEPETPIKDWPCDKHNYYRKSCDNCREIRT